MPRYKVQDPTTGKSITLEGDSPPTEQELTDIFGQMGGAEKPAAAPAPEPTPQPAPEPTPKPAPMSIGAMMLSQAEFEQQDIKPIELPVVGKEGTVLRGVSKGVTELVKSATTAEGVALASAMLVPGVAPVLGPVLGAAATKQAAMMAGEYSVTKNPETLGEATVMGTVGVVGTAAPLAKLGLGKVAEKAPASAEAVKTAAEVLKEPAKEEPVKATEEPPEPAPEPAATAEPPVPQFIGIKNERVDMQRADRGLEPIMSAARRADTELWDTAMKRVDADPTLEERLVKDLSEKPRPMTDEETIIVTRHLADLTNQLDQSRWEGIKAIDEVKTLEDTLRDPATNKAEVQSRISELRAQAVEAEARAGELSDRLSVAEQAVGRGGAGTEMGRAFRARQLLLRQDFSLAGLERQKRAANGFEPLSEKQAAEIRATAEEYAAANKQLEARVSDLQKVADQAQMKRELAELQAAEAKSQLTVTGRVKAVVEKVGAALDKRADAARARLRGKLLSISPADLADLAEIGAANIYHMGLDFARWSTKMVEELGEKIKPHLDEIWKASQRLMDESINVEAGAKAGKPKTAKPDVSPEAIRDTIHKRIRNRITDYEERLAAGDFTPAKRSKAILNDPETLRLQFKLEQVKRKFYEGLIEDKMRQRSAPQKIFGGFMESLNAMRAVLTSTDLSAVLRQGKFIGLGHPIRSLRSVPDMLRAFGSEAQAFKVEQQIANRPNYPLYRASKLYLAEHGVALSRMEEAYMSRWAGKIPGVGFMVKASERAYTTFLNKLRADSFDAMAKTLGRGGEISVNEAKVLSNFINVATGRGTIGMAEQAAVGLNTVFFAPKFVASRFQMLLGQPIYHGLISGKVKWAGTGRARALVAREYGQMLAGAAIVYSIAHAAGFKIGTDPRSSDWGKIIIGNTRIDPMAGLNQATVFLSREISGQKTTVAGKTVPIRGKVPYGGATAMDVAAQFARSKFAPAPGLVADIAQGKDVVGNPVTLSSVAKRSLIPMSIGDIYATMQEQGLPESAILAVLTIFGESIQNYSPRVKEK